MRTRSVILLVSIICMVFAQNVFAAVPASGNIPVYPGGNVVVELSFTNKDFLPAIREFISLWPTFMSAAFAPAISKSNGQGDQPSQALEAMLSQMNETLVPELQAAIADMNQISIVGYTIPKKVKSNQMADFYMQKMGLSKGWMRSITVQDPKGSGSIRVYTKPDLESMLGIAVKESRVLVFQTQGKVDLAAIVRLSGKVTPILISTFAGHREPAPKSEPEIEQPMPSQSENSTNPAT